MEDEERGNKHRRSDNNMCVCSTVLQRAHLKKIHRDVKRHLFSQCKLRQRVAKRYHLHIQLIRIFKNGCITCVFRFSPPWLFCWSIQFPPMMMMTTTALCCLLYGRTDGWMYGRKRLLQHTHLSRVCVLCVCRLRKKENPLVSTNERSWNTDTVKPG